MNYLPTRGLPIVRNPGQVLEDAKRQRKRENDRRYRAEQKQEREGYLARQAGNILNFQHLSGKA